MNPQAQSRRILSYLRRGRTLTPLQALDKFDCWRLGARIRELRKQGYPIQTELVERQGKRFARYRMGG